MICEGVIIDSVPRWLFALIPHICKLAFFAAFKAWVENSSTMVQTFVQMTVSVTADHIHDPAAFPQDRRTRMSI